jgi:hypothetical protein
MAEDSEYEPPIRPPARRGFNFGGGGGGGGGGSNIVTTGIIALIVSVVVFMGMGFLGGGSFVLRKDFTANMVQMADTIKVVDGKVDTANSTAKLAKDTADKYEGEISKLQKADTLFITSDKLKDYATTSALNDAISKIKVPDISGLETKTDTDAKIKKLQDQIDELKKGNTGTVGAVTGQVAVSIDTTTPAQFNGATPQTIKVNINNQTNSYQYVSYFVNLNLSTPTTLSFDNTTMSMPLMTYNSITIPLPPNPTSQILFTPTGKILVPPGITSAYYLITVKPIAQPLVWTVSISNITATVTP